MFLNYHYYSSRYSYNYYVRCYSITEVCFFVYFPCCLLMCIFNIFMVFLIKFPLFLYFAIQIQYIQCKIGP